MSFASPLLLSSLLLLPLGIGAYIWAQRRRVRYAARFTNLDLLANVVEASPGWRRHLPPALAIAALAAIGLALARPQVTMAVAREEAGVVLAMDTSGSMTAADVEPTRIDAARSAAASFLDGLPEHFRVGLVSFAESADVLVSPTDDREVVYDAVDSLEANGGTALGDAILRSVELAPEPAASAGEQSDEPLFSVLLLSDGANSTGIEPERALELAADAGVAVHTVALGTDAGSVEVTDDFGTTRTVQVPPDRDTLRRIAEQTGGRYFEALTDADLEAVYEEIGSQVAFEDEKREITAAFAGAAGALLLAGAGLSLLWFGRLP